MCIFYHHSPTTSEDVLSDEIIMELAREVPHDKFDVLGVKLDKSWTSVDNTLHRHGKDTAKAATEIMMAWKTKNGAGLEQAKQLKVILDKAELRYLSTKLASEITKSASSLESESVRLPVAQACQGMEPAPTTAAVTPTPLHGGKFNYFV